MRPGSEQDGHSLTGLTILLHDYCSNFVQKLDRVTCGPVSRTCFPAGGNNALTVYELGYLEPTPAPTLAPAESASVEFENLGCAADDRMVSPRVRYRDREPEI